MFVRISNRLLWVAVVVVALVVGGVPGSVVTAEAAGCTAPSGPSSVTAAPLNSAVKVSWAAASANGCALVVYRVAASPGNVTVTAAATATTATVSGLTNGQAYTFIVAVGYVAGDASTQWVSSDPSAPAVPQTQPGVPSSVSGVPGNASVDVTWSAPASDGGSAITGYRVVVMPGGRIVNVTTPVTTVKVSSLANGTAYTFTVAAKNAAGVGAASAPSPPVTPRTVPGAPTGVAGVSLNQAVALSWVAPSGTGGTPITGYRIYRKPGGVVTTLNSPTTQTTVDGLVNGTAYTFKVAAVNEAGAGVYSVTSASVTPRPTAPGPPTAVAAVGGAYQASVSWVAPSSNGGSAITGYVVTATPGGAAVTVGSTATSATVTGLVGGQSYTFSVVATNANGQGPASAPSNPITLASGPAAPMNVLATPDWYQVKVDWTPVDNGFPAAQYAVLISPGDLCFYTASTSLTAGGVYPGQSYRIRVFAQSTAHNTCVRGAGDSEWSSPIDATTKNATPWPPTLIDDEVGDGSVRVTWSSVPNAVTYTVTAQPGGVSRTVPARVMSAVLAGLDNGQTYNVTVAANNAEGTALSSVIRITPDAGLPSELGATMTPLRRGDPPAISDNGRYIAWSEGYQSGAGSNPSKLMESIYVADTVAQTTSRIAKSAGMGWVSISADGRFISFVTPQGVHPDDLNQKSDLYVYDQQTDSFTVASTGFSGSGDGEVQAAVMSSDGTTVAFVSTSSNLVQNDVNGQRDLFVRRSSSGPLTLVEAGGLVDGARRLFLSGDGGIVAGTPSLGPTITAFACEWQGNGCDHYQMPAQYAASESVGVSRDGSRIFFLNNWDNLTTGKSRFDVYVSNVGDPFNATNMTTDNLGVAESVAIANVSPDGSVVSYMRVATYNRDVLIKDKDSIGLYFDGQWTASDGYVGPSVPVFAADNQSMALISGGRVMVQRLARGNSTDDGQVWTTSWRQSVNTLTGVYARHDIDTRVGGGGCSDGGDPLLFERRR